MCVREQTIPAWHGKTSFSLFLGLSTPVDLWHLRLSVRPSLGISLWLGDGGTAEALLRNADAAKERAMRQAIDYAFFNERADLPAYPPAFRSNSQPPPHFGYLDA